MRVSVNFDPSGSPSVNAAAWFDLAAEPAALERIEAARLYPPLRSLLANLNSAESPLWTCGSKVWSSGEGSAAEPFVFAARLDLIFSRSEANAQPGPQESLGQKLVSLLGREKADALRAELQVLPAELRGGGHGYCLRVILFAQGAAAEQAQVRWGLGMARLQQALLFAAREMRREAGVSR